MAQSKKTIIDAVVTRMQSVLVGGTAVSVYKGLRDSGLNEIGTIYVTEGQMTLSSQGQRADTMELEVVLYLFSINSDIAALMDALNDMEVQVFDKLYNTTAGGNNDNCLAGAALSVDFESTTPLFLQFDAEQRFAKQMIFKFKFMKNKITGVN